MVGLVPTAAVTLTSKVIRGSTIGSQKFKREEYEGNLGTNRDPITLRGRERQIGAQFPQEKKIVRAPGTYCRSCATSRLSFALHQAVGPGVGSEPRTTAGLNRRCGRRDAWREEGKRSSLGIRPPGMTCRRELVSFVTLTPDRRLLLFSVSHFSSMAHLRREGAVRRLTVGDTTGVCSSLEPTII